MEIVTLAVILFLLIQMLILRWIFRVNEQISYLRQIYEQLMQINNKTGTAKK
jgi:hypothetical protein